MSLKVKPTTSTRAVASCENTEVLLELAAASLRKVNDRIPVTAADPRLVSIAAGTITADADTDDPSPFLFRR